MAIAKERKYCGLLQDTIDGAMETARDKDAAAQELSLILAEESEEMAVIKRKQVAELEASSRRSGADTPKQLNVSRRTELIS